MLSVNALYVSHFQYCHLGEFSFLELSRMPVTEDHYFSSFECFFELIKLSAASNRLQLKLLRTGISTNNRVQNLNDVIKPHPSLMKMASASQGSFATYFQSTSLWALPGKCWQRPASSSCHAWDHMLRITCSPENPSLRPKGWATFDRLGHIPTLRGLGGPKAIRSTWTAWPGRQCGGGSGLAEATDACYTCYTGHAHFPFIFPCLHSVLLSYLLFVNSIIIDPFHGSVFTFFFSFGKGFQASPEVACFLVSSLSLVRPFIYQYHLPHLSPWVQVGLHYPGCILGLWVINSSTVCACFVSSPDYLQMSLLMSSRCFCLISQSLLLISPGTLTETVWWSYASSPGICSTLSLHQAYMSSLSEMTLPG